MSTALALGTDRRRAEQKALEQIAERVAQQFPDLPRQQIAEAVRGHYAQFDASRIRDFIPVLVERAVRDDLRR